MKLLKKIHKKESGQAFILVLILLLLGGLMLGPLLGFMGTGLKAGQAYEQKMDEVYAADAGIEDAIYKILNDDALLPTSEGDSETYPLSNSVNGETVIVTVTQLSLLQGILSEDEFKLDQPHEDWIAFDPEQDVNPVPGGLQYSSNISFEFVPEAGQGQTPRQVETIGVFFSPLPSGTDPASLIHPPVYDSNPLLSQIEYLPIITRDFLVGDEPEEKIVPAGFAFLWRWQTQPFKGPIFETTPPNNVGAIEFTFQIDDPSWSPRIYYAFATIKSEDVSYVVNKEFYKWLIEATAGGTTVQSAVVEESSGASSIIDILTWEINPQE